jgi:hypothetical protein
MPSRSSFTCKVLLAAAVLLAGPYALAQTPMPERYPSGSIRSEQIADQALKEVEVERRAIETRFAETERACYDRFFATSCVQKAKDARRDSLAKLRAIEVEAHTFKRRQRADEHERAAAERTAKREAQASERLQSATTPQASGDSGTE